MIETTISVPRLVAACLWTLAAVAVVLAAVFASLAFLGNVGLLLGIAAATATVRCYLTKIANLVRVTAANPEPSRVRAMR